MVATLIGQESLESNVLTGIENIGNEGLFPLIETMDHELGLNPLDNEDNRSLHNAYVDDLEKSFCFLYNSKLTINDQHKIHDSLYKSLKFLDMKGVKDGKFFEELTAREENGKMTGFTSRFLNYLKNSTVGLKATLELYTDTHYLFKENLHDIEKTNWKHGPISKAQFDEMKRFHTPNITQDQIKGFLFDHDFHQKLVDEEHAAKYIKDCKSDIIDYFIKQLEKNIIGKTSRVLNRTLNDELNTKISTIFSSLDDAINLSTAINEIVKFSLVQNKESLKTYLSRELFGSNDKKLLDIANPNDKITDLNQQLIEMLQKNLVAKVFYYIKDQDQARGFLSDRVYKEILDNELSDDGKKADLALSIAAHYTQQFINDTLSKVNTYIVGIDGGTAQQDYNLLIGTIYKLVENIHNSATLVQSVSDLANLDIVKNNKELRAYLGKTLFIPNAYENSSKILEIYDNDHDILDFKPELAEKAKEQISSKVLHKIKQGFSQKIYNNDFLIERYLPTHARGIRNEGWYLKSELTSILDDISDNDRDVILTRIIDDYRKAHPASNCPPYQQQKDAYKPGEPFFNKIFFDDDTSLTSLLIDTQIVKDVNNIQDIMSQSVIDRISKLCADLYNTNADKLYCILVSNAGYSLDPNTIIQKNSNGIAIGINVQELTKLIKTEYAKNKLFADLILSSIGKTYYDLENEIYKYRFIHTKAAMQRELSYRTTATEFQAERLFRNSTATQLHNVNDTTHEYHYLQTGDTQASNISFTIIPEIAISYANKGDPHNSWIEIFTAQQGINTTELMERLENRSPAQEFAVPSVNPENQLGSIRIEKVAHFPHNRAQYRIIDGFLSEELYEQMKDNRILILTGVEDKYRFFLEVAFLFHDKALGGHRLDKVDKSKLEFSALKDAEQHRVPRTNYQNIFDMHYIRKDYIDKYKGNIYHLSSLVNYHNQIRELRYQFDHNHRGDYYSNIAANQQLEGDYMNSWQLSKYPIVYREVLDGLKFQSQEEEFFRDANSDDLKQYIKKAITSKPVTQHDDVTKNIVRAKYAVKKLYDGNLGTNFFKELIETSSQDKINHRILGAIVNYFENISNDHNFHKRLSAELQSQLKEQHDLEIVSREKIDDQVLNQMRLGYEYNSGSHMLLKMIDPTKRNDNTLCDYNEKIWEDIKNKPLTSTNPQERFSGIYKDFSGKNLEDGLRTFPEIVGGNYDINGNVLTDGTPKFKSYTFGYLPVTQNDIKVLEHNKLITILEVHKIDNPHTSATHVIKYRYTDLRDVNKLSEYLQPSDNRIFHAINSLMDTDISYVANLIGINNIQPQTKLRDLNDQDFRTLINGHKEYLKLKQEGYTHKLLELAKIESALKKHPEYAMLIEDFGRLNKEFLKNILYSTLHDSTLNHLQKYQKLASLHPLNDMNSEVIRMNYQKDSGQPFYMFDMNKDIIASNAQMTNELNNYKHIIGALNKEYLEAQEINAQPNYYENSKIWLSLFGIDPYAYTYAQSQALMNKIKQVASNDDIITAIENNDYYYFYNKIMQSIYSFHSFKILSQRDSEGNSALHLACINNHNLSSLLIKADEQKINLHNHKNIYGQTPIHVAACNFNFNAIYKCLENNPTLESATDAYNKTYYNNIMDNIKSATQYEFDAFIKFSKTFRLAC